tara:strand:- start:1529 stop:2176 length:648 start_codon:yes stop_codon:yes gene_type:complete
MYWEDEGFLLSKKNFDENSIIIEVFTSDHGKYSGIVYGGSSRKQKRNFQIGNKLFINFKSKNERKIGYFNIELIKPISPLFFNDKERSICILSASTILKILLPERQINKKIYDLFNDFLLNLNLQNWIQLYIHWEISLIKELGFEVDLNKSSNFIMMNNRSFKIPKILLNKSEKNIPANDIKEALIFNKNLIIENFILPNKLKLPVSRNILEKYF